TYYLAKGPPRIQPVGGGETIHRELSRAAQAAGVKFRYSCAADQFVSEDGELSGVRLASGETLPANAVVLACGGFQANAQMM
ncbi:FAD-binding protein, partial [Streptomyces galilaeus]|uniref:FAD-binding protein n=1 Tax=Streptomyces galilaeus TaxID=33899 RepID=UPI0038F69F70